MQLYVQSVGLMGPGLNGWVSTQPILTGSAPYRFGDTPRVVPSILPATERRRSSDAVRLAIAAAEEALRGSEITGNETATVFASSDGDGYITHQICEALTTREKEISPTSFHNSVYNAPAGYWSIAIGSRLGSTSLCAFDGSFVAGLLEAAAQTCVDHRPVMLIASDLPFPFPLYALRPIEHAFSVAILMTPDAGRGALMQWQIQIGAREPATSDPAGLPAGLYRNPAARCLPLLRTLACRSTETVVLDYLDNNSVTVSCQPVVPS
ncbi:hypothetical protein W02_28600 [Nitrospira sp. KM1]|uniref:beta-ketoacyl synthase chain length factor n=1 Tax=Nitrospira sp. KM1 TaxID=1936990 RepID=UPI0013A74097|nr:beta-ketoacyl synthase chain length factor [Nitrospira sp. KM1]BCA55720.1 hypothetical protein W02_28600 [Nitrospira sp. KM1]